MKHGSGSEGEYVHSANTISPCSPVLPQLWEVSVANKGAPMYPNNYMNSFGHWYPNHHPHQDTMPRPQMMWVECFFWWGGGSACLLSPLWTDLDFSACVFIVFCVLGILFFLTRLLTMSLQQFSSLNMWIQTVDSGTLKINVCAWVYLFLAWEFPLKCPTNSLRILQINDCWISVIVVTFVLSTCQTQSKQVTVGIYQFNFEGAAGCSAELSCETLTNKGL